MDQEMHGADSDLVVDEWTGRLLNEMQSGFPLVAHPYQTLGERVGMDEAEAFARVSVAAEAGLVRQLSAIFDTRGLGYASSLVAMKVAPERLDRAVAVVNAHPGVSHNYLRSHEFNVWFTIAVPGGAQLPQVIDTLGTLAGATASRPLPTLRLFKIGVALDVTGRTDRRRSGPRYTQHEQDRAMSTPLSVEDIEFIRVAQRNWLHALDPFQAIAGVLHWPVERVLHRARVLHTSGHLRRFAAILHHRRVGFGANGMGVWEVPDADIERVGTLFARHSAVSHCYLRGTHPDWPFNVFTMIHGRSRDAVDAVAAELSAESRIPDPQILYSTREFKKQRVMYFTPQHAHWHALCKAAACATKNGAPGC